MMSGVEYLVLSGGALKGISFLGVLECLERKQHLKCSKLKTLVGSSVGSIICSLISIGYSCAELFKETLELNFESLAEPDLDRLLNDFGLDSGRLVLKKLQHMFLVKGIDPNITFLQHYKFTKKHLVITVSCLGKGVCYLDYKSQPHLNILLAIRMSISIPLVFTPVRYEGDFYVDGGLLDNTPISFLCDVDPNKIVVIRTASYEKLSIKDISTGSFLWLLVQTTLGEIERLRLESKRTLKDIHYKSTIVIDNKNISMSSQIALTKEDKLKLFSTGYQTAKSYLESPKWIKLCINQLPWKPRRLIWQQVHLLKYKDVLTDLKKNKK